MYLNRELSVSNSHKYNAYWFVVNELVSCKRCKLLMISVPILEREEEGNQ